MKNKNKKHILSQMFDVRPVNKAGDLDLERINKIERVLYLRRKKEKTRINLCKKRKSKKIIEILTNSRAKLIQLDNFFKSDQVPIRYKFDGRDFFEAKKEQNIFKHTKEEFFIPKEQSLLEIINRKNILNVFDLKKITFQFALACFLIFLLITTPIIVNRGYKLKNTSLKKGEIALVNLAAAKDNFSNMKFQASIYNLKESQEKFEEISNDLDKLGFLTVESGRFFPFLSKITSGKYIAEAGKKISQIGILVNQTAEILDNVKNPIEGNNSFSLLQLFQVADKNLKSINQLMKDLEKDLARINVDDLPKDKRGMFIEVKSKFPQIEKVIAGFIHDSQILNDILGGNGPRKYLFLFQNNNEMRATGGFIGTYALLDIFNGKIKKLIVDGIFNPDGQLKEKIVPPKPMQKISAAWSLHDSNWWPNFPDSAEKATWFWEKTGGPTVDGVITMTPQVLKSLLAITGPIEMPEYNKIINQDNFIDEVQQEVEVDYDKNINQPKKILADLAPKILDRVFSLKSPVKLAQTLNVLNENLSQKHILLYSTNFNIQNLIREKGWSGEILDTQKDYLSVINTNINGYKTDGVIDEKIEHQAEIKEDGSIIDTVTITRHHNGGNKKFDWFNKVNADYQRIYVPAGSKLISVEGQTREFNQSPLDYDALSFKRDTQVMMEEQDMIIDEKSGTRIYNEKNKTVFANWIYVSPQETVRIVYHYQLPFKINFKNTSSNLNTYSLLVQKQSGSLGSDLFSKILLPSNLKVIWKYPESNLKKNKQGLEYRNSLKKDRFWGIAIEKQYD
jgi:hypothetical protein